MATDLTIAEQGLHILKEWTPRNPSPEAYDLLHVFSRSHTIQVISQIVQQMPSEILIPSALTFGVGIGIEICRQFGVPEKAL